jgi:hypothetical protein
MLYSTLPEISRHPSKPLQLYPTGTLQGLSPDDGLQGLKLPVVRRCGGRSLGLGGATAETAALLPTGGHGVAGVGMAIRGLVGSVRGQSV